MLANESQMVLCQATTKAIDIFSEFAFLAINQSLLGVFVMENEDSY